MSGECDHWDFDAHKRPILERPTSLEVTLVNFETIGVRLEFAQRSEDPLDRMSPLQFALPSEGLASLIADLTRVMAEIRRNAEALKQSH